MWEPDEGSSGASTKGRGARSEHGCVAGGDPDGDPRWLAASDCAVADLARVVAQRAEPGEYPLASSLEAGVVVYDSAVVAELSERGGDRQALRRELVRCLAAGPGVVVFRGAFACSELVDQASRAFEAMIADQHQASSAPGDHFATPGANDRVWNALEKLAVGSPEIFVDYYANDVVALVCGAWLGPGYQVTSQVNVVNPLGQAQSPHRDYHLGFQEEAVVEQMSLQVQKMSQYLTLQGAVAHCDMPVETGPTMYLPHSQNYDAGYLAWRRPDFQAFFEANYVQLPLAKGDAVFFNPAVMHAAGSNQSTSVRRMANLLQVSSPFGRAMESVDRARVSAAIYPVLAKRRADGTPDAALRNVVAASAEGYPFPTNLDYDPPLGAGLAPNSQADLVWLALVEGWDLARLERELEAHSARRQSARRPA